MPSNNLRANLICRIKMEDVNALCLLCKSDTDCKEKLYQLVSDTDKRVAVNALWILTHFGKDEDAWLFMKHDDLVDKALTETFTPKLRMTLQLLLRQPFDKDTMRAEFIDFCLEQMVSCAQPYAVRALCMKLAYKQMHHFPELLAELKMAIDVLSNGELSPGLKSARRQVMTLINKKLKDNVYEY